MASRFCRRDGELRLVVVLPDGTPGMVAAAATDVFGTGDAEMPITLLSVEGVRRLRVMVTTVIARDTLVSGRRARWWKVVRCSRGADPFLLTGAVLSAHTSEAAARRAAQHHQAGAIAESGYAVAQRWAWSVVFDPAGVLIVGTDGAREQR